MKEKESVLKEWLVNYTGQNHKPVDDKITVEMIIETVADEFPEFLLVVAEENFIRGYEQALEDVDKIRKKYGNPNETIHQNLASSNP